MALVLATALVASACARPAAPVREPAARARVVATISGEVDAAAGTLAIGAAAATAAGALVDIPVVQDGVPGSGPPNTVELVTERTATVPGGCGPVDGFEGDVRLRSFYAGYKLRSAYAEIVSITPTGREACNSAPAVAGVSAQYGLFSYGTLAAAGTAGDSAVATWRFRLPDSTRFTFTGRIMADLVEAVPPTIVAVTPHPKQGDVPVTAAVSVTFSEPMDGATVAALSLGGPGGPVAGTVVPGAGNAWTFTPSAPLAPATRYTIAVSTAATDLAGNPLAAPHASWFVTVTPTAVVSGPGSADYAHPVIAQDASGNRLALFSAVTYSGAEVLWSYYDAGTGTWSPEQAILVSRAHSRPGLPIESKIATNGTTFLAAWQNPADGAIETALFTGGRPGAVVKQLGADYANTPVFDLASSGTGYALVSNYLGHVGARVYNGSYWDYGAGPNVDGLAGTTDSPALAPLGTSSYLAAFRFNGTSVYTSRYAPSTRTWATTALPGASGTAAMVAPAVAASGARACVAWGTTASPVRVSTDTGTGAFGAATDLTAGGGLPATMKLWAAANGNRLAVAWGSSAATYESSGGMFPTWYWTGDRSLTGQTGWGTSAGVVPAADGFVAGLRITPVGSVAPGDAWVNKDVPGSGFLWTNGLLAESWPGDVKDVSVSGRAGAPALLAWVRDDGTAMRVETKTFDGAALGPEAQVSLPGVPGSAAHVRLARNAGGDLLAAWQQDDRGAKVVFAAMRRGHAWEPPVQLASAAVEPEVASDGSGFMVLYRDLGASGSESTLTAIEYAAGAWSAPVVLETLARFHGIASDGASYAAAWQFSGAIVHAAIKLGSSAWGGLTSVSGASPAPSYYRPTIAARPGEYLLAWHEASGGLTSVLERRAVIIGTPSPWAWYSSSVVWSGLPSVSGLPFAAASPGGYVLAWTDTSAARAAVYSGTAWGPVTAIAAAGSCRLARAGAAASGYLAAFDCGGVQLARYAAGAWGQAVQPGIAASDLAVASDGADYKVLARVDKPSPVPGGGTASLYQIDVVDSNAYPPALLASGTSPAVAPIADVALLHDGTDWVAAWTQQGPDPIADRVIARTAF